MSTYTTTRSRIFQWMGIILAFGLIAVGYWYYQSQASTLNKSPTGLLTDNLVGYWSFDASSTSSSTATDQGSGGNNGTLTNSPEVTEGKNGQALNFFPNGSDNNSRIDMGDPVDGDLDFGSGDFSVGFWMKGNGYSSQGNANNAVLGKKNMNSANAAGYIFYYTSANVMRFTVGNGTSETSVIESVGTVATNGWHYYVGVRSGSTIYLYVDGEVIGSNSTSGSVSNGFNFVVGTEGSVNQNDRNANAIVDEVRVYNAAITTTQIRSLYQLGVSDKVNTSVSQSQGAGRLDSALALYYALDSSSGSSATDSSTNGNTGTLTNMEDGDWVSAQIGNGLDFDGADEYITLADTDTLDMTNAQNFTLTGWFNRDTFAADHTILAKRSGILNSDDGYIVFVDDATDQLVFEASESGGTDEYGMSSTSTFTSSGWHHYAVVWDDTSSSATGIYIDGVRETVTTAGTFANVASLANSVAFTLGAESDAGNPFDGKLDEARVYHRALSADEVASLYRLTSPTGIDTGLKGYWSFDGQTTSSATAFDLSGTGSNSTLLFTTIADGKAGQGMEFNGSSAFMSAGDVAILDVNDTTDLTLSGWFYRDTSTSVDTIVTKRNTSSAQGYSVFLHDSNDKLYFELHDGTDEYQITSTQTFTSPGWYHFVAVWDQDSAANSEIYINGVDDNGTDTGTIGNIGDLTNTTSFQFGANPATPDYFDGKLDEIRLYKRALTEAEAKSLYDAGQSDKVNSSISQPQGTGRLDSGLVGYWAMDNGSGTSATDSSTNGNTGTLTNGPTWTTGQIGGAVDFDGTDDYINVADANVLDITQAITLSAWVRGDSWTNTEGNFIFAKNDYDGVERRNYYFMVNTSGNLGFGFDDNSVSGSLFSTTTLSTGQWYFVTATYDRKNIKLYENGALVRTTAETDTMTANTNVLSIGRAQRNSTTDYGEWDGFIDEARLYNRALSDDEISQLYRLSTPTGVDTGLKGYWSFNGQDMNGTTSAYDRSGAGNNGTTSGGPTITEGRIGQALSFDGSNDYVTIPNAASLAGSCPMTTTAWVKRDASGEQDFILKKRGDTNDGWTMLINSSNQLQITFFGIADKTSTSTITDTNWHHVAVSVDVSCIPTFYIDGAAAGAASAFSSAPTGTSSALYMGVSLDTGGSITGYTDQGIDEARIYNRALSAGEIAALYNQGR